MADKYRDQLGQEIGLNDLVVWGHSGRYAGTRIGRVYLSTRTGIRVWIFEWSTREKAWVRGSHSTPSDPVKVEGPVTSALIPPLLEDSRLRANKKKEA